MLNLPRSATTIGCSLIFALSSAQSYAKQPNVNHVDRALVNHKQIAYWLKKRDPELRDANPQQMTRRVNQYIERYEATNQRELTKRFEPLIHQESSERRLKRLGVKKQGNMVTSNVFVVLVDFPDLSHSNPGFGRQDTPMYYADYSLAHYSNLLFSLTGYVGPNGESFSSARQYFDKESGGSFEFDGSVFGWYTAQNNAKYYGETAENSSDVRPEELVIEAVTAAVAAGTDLTPFDQDNNGVIDHILVIHSSIGEEAGGGNLGSDAIWSHSFSAASQTTGQPTSIPGSTIKVANYTIQPIDSAIGVVVHEFGHDLGLRDEYDISSSEGPGSPVEEWSIMSGGSWAGRIPGTEPSTFSPIAREHFQDTLGGNWINQRTIESDTLSGAALDIMLSPATDHGEGFNQVRINLPATQLDFKQPYQGQKQFYSGKVSNRRAALTLNSSLPASTDLKLSFKAQWAMENNFDYGQVLVNGQPVANDLTAASDANIPGVIHYFSGVSPNNQWQQVDFDLTPYAGQTVTIEILYVTDAFINEFGLVVDALTITSDSTVILSEDAETAGSAALTHFKRIGAKVDGAPRNYYLQYRNLQGLDSALTRYDYEPGLLLWFRNQNFDNNDSSVHPGSGFISVVDADQVMIGNRNTGVQLRDATFSLLSQQPYIGDTNLDTRPTFNDLNDYTSPNQPQSGVILPTLGINFTVNQQNEQLGLSLAKSPVALSTDFSTTVNGLTVAFSPMTLPASRDVTYVWDFGDGESSNAPAPVHGYPALGTYKVSVTVTDGEGNQATKSKDIIVAPALEVSVAASVELLQSSLSVDLKQGTAPFNVVIDYGDGQRNESTVETLGLVKYEHQYQRSAQYVQTITITDSMQQVFEYSGQITTNSGLTASFTHSASDLVVSFSAVVEGGAGDNVYTWNFGDSTTSQSASPSHTYSRSGTYSVELSVSDASGLNVLYRQSINVTAAAPTTSVPTPTATSSEGSSGGGLNWVFIVALSFTSVFRLRKLLK